ncbi:MAG: hypothetical protein ACI8RD_001798 [Bacillariaceae sp.]|jgi:hypothetical protein
MLEVSISIVAWISVVVIQALFHYFVFGARKERMIQQETEAVLEDSFSFTTSDSYSSIIETELDTAIISTPNTPTSAPFFSSSSSIIASSFKQSETAAAATTTTTASTTHQLTSAERAVYLKLSKSEEFENSNFYLMQTGSEMLKVRSFLFLFVSVCMYSVI